MERNSQQKFRKPSASRKLFRAPLPNFSCAPPGYNSSEIRRGSSVSTRSYISSSRETSENPNNGGGEEKENWDGSTRAVLSKAKLAGRHSNSPGTATVSKAVGSHASAQASNALEKVAPTSALHCTGKSVSVATDIAHFNEIILSNPQVRVKRVEESIKLESTGVEGEAVSRKRKATGEEYEVDKVLAVWFDKRQPPSFLIKWANYSYEVCTWEWKTNVQGCTSKIREYSERQQVRMLIANELQPEEKQGFRYDGAFLYESSVFYPCHLWEDEMNGACGMMGLAPIYVENWVDAEAKPKNFTYITKNIIPDETRRLFVPLPKLEHCECAYGECGSSENCCPKEFNMTYGYTPAGRLRSTFNKRENQIVECCDDCGCGPDCPTKVVQRGRKIPVMIFRTLQKGWGMRTMEKIRKNSFVMEYLGVVLDIESASDKKSAVYQFEMGPVSDHPSVNLVETPQTLEQFKKPKFLIEAANFGNEARFVNHSCDPNLYAEPVFADRFDNKYLRIAYFASRDIGKGEELTIDYRIVTDRPKANGTKRKQRSCFCHSANCNGHFM